MLSLTKKEIKNREWFAKMTKEGILRIEDRLRERESKKLDYLIEGIIKKELEKI
jgi:hypothetical protein